jgi:hypothetical protein
MDYYLRSRVVDYFKYFVVAVSHKFVSEHSKNLNHIILFHCNPYFRETLVNIQSLRVFILILRLKIILVRTESSLKEKKWIR